MYMHNLLDTAEYFLTC